MTIFEKVWAFLLVVVLLGMIVRWACGRGDYDMHTEWWNRTASFWVAACLLVALLMALPLAAYRIFF